LGSDEIDQLADRLYVGEFEEALAERTHALSAGVTLHRRAGRRRIDVQVFAEL
jgi:hypothetical protein